MLNSKVIIYCFKLENRCLTCIFGLQPCDKVAMLVDKAIQIFVCRICLKKGFNSQRRETLLFMSIDMAAVTSTVNQQ